MLRPLAFAHWPFSDAGGEIAAALPLKVCCADLSDALSRRCWRVDQSISERISWGTRLASGGGATKERPLILLSMSGKAEDTLSLELTDLRVSGGVLWNHLD